MSRHRMSAERQARLRVAQAQRRLLAWAVDADPRLDVRFWEFVEDQAALRGLGASFLLALADVLDPEDPASHRLVDHILGPQ